ncbi:helix-turn-helix domain-containing protein [Flavobacterium arcticum]|uniref:helix-turn-helix domain-containing protein n=1 Tax=Flavobacterium arcticum TaxID=1784713 RepID=UPI00196721A6|nr:helix-turn-helix domain-containing protein [Flavobacterium arcticum]
MVENNYRKHHEVQYYASALNKSPKTLANVFALYGKKTPLQIIQERVVNEAKRLLYYTDKSIKEIAVETGFEDTSHFSRFFKKQTSFTPTEFKNSIKKVE